MSNASNDLITRVLDLCTAKGLSKSAFCRLADIPVTSFSNWCNRGSMPRVEYIERMARALGVSVQYLRFGSDAGRPSPTAYAAEDGDFSLSASMRELTERISDLDPQTQRDLVDIYTRILDLRGF